MRIRLVLTGLAVLCVPAAAMAGPIVDGLLGSPCDADQDCSVAGLGCWLPDAPPGTPGPVNGLCTLGCEAHEDCAAVDPAARCWSGVCLEGCEPGTSGREPRRLNPVFGVFSGAVCAPRCTGHAECAAFFCGPRSGLCEPARSEGDAPGSACDVTAGASTSCRGVCLGDGVCRETCTLGVDRGAGRVVASAESPRANALRREHSPFSRLSG